jgi:uncharacterized protein
MQMHEISFDGPPPIEAYGEGGFRLGGVRHLGSLALLPTRMQDWPVATPGMATPQAVAPFLAAADGMDLLLFGMGLDIAHLPADSRRALEDAGVGVEVMSTPAACRTYNVLLAEGRRVCAALIAV